MKSDNYKKYFTRELMMGPNSIRLLDEIITNNPEAINGGNVLDLGCGMALTSLFLAKETAVKHIYATDLWIDATTNHKQLKEWGVEDAVIPIHADAHNLPYANGFFDTIVSIDSFHYFACEDGFFAGKILPLMKTGGSILIVIPGVKKEYGRNIPEIMKEWAEDEASFFHSCAWWKEHVCIGCEERIEVDVSESKLADLSWQEWFQSGHEYASRDKAFFDRGLMDLLTFVEIRVKRIS